LVVAGPQQAVLVLGPPRSGKTSALVVPNVLAAWGAVVSTSTKPDVLAATAPARAQRGRCWLYDPSGTVPLGPGLAELRWSPVTAAGTWDGALLLARAIVGAAHPAWGVAEASHWTERAEALIAPLLHAAAIADRDLATVVGWVNRHDGRTAARLLGAGTAADLLEGILATDKREQSSIWSTASGALAAYRSDAALASASAPNFDPRAFVASGDTVYVCAAGRHQGLVAPLVAGLLEDVRSAAFDRSAARLTGDVRRVAPSAWSGPEPPLLLALDEVANIAPLPDLPALVSEGGGQGVLTLACFQDLSQARRRWGPAADGFGSLFGATVVLPGIGDVRTLEALSVLCGSQDVWVRSESTGRQRSQTWSTRRQRRLDPDEVARGQAGHGLLLGGGRAPTWTPLTPWWAVPGWGPARQAPVLPGPPGMPGMPGPPGMPGMPGMEPPGRQGPSVGWGGR
ncbi:MAG TPA: type IV secretory system conjugative DNA transfer family protein, partial [Acidimicrobiales bacterium]|nr:type IV secretory system conjugative DNA transfer family protein [Acidimicrobiales bacterium]